MVWLSTDGFQKGGLVMVLFWWGWFLKKPRHVENREILISIAVAAPFAVGLSRLISLMVPFRGRPLYNPQLDVRIAYDLPPRTMETWNSFPSDHAVLFFTLVTGLFLLSRWIGLISALYVVLFVCIPRIFLGVHYPVDILAGAMLGIGVGYLATLEKVRSVVSRPILRWVSGHPSSFYAFCFFYTYQVSNAFGWIRDVITLAVTIVSGAISKIA
jgi:undecaprenyl-diphosphatase